MACGLSPIDVVQPFWLLVVVLVVLLPPNPRSLGLTDRTVGKWGEGGLHRFRLSGVVERCDKLGTDEAAREFTP